VWTKLKREKVALGSSSGQVVESFDCSKPIGPQIDRDVLRGHVGASSVD
jgi:hypothetical protein